MITKAVILARGLGTRMRKADPGAALDASQAAVADQGIKAMMPVGRPFLDYVLSGLADAGYDDVCLVIGPEHRVIVDRYTRDFVPQRLRVDFAFQPEPLGTAHALPFALPFTAGQRFVVMNGDNYYGVEALAALRSVNEPALPAFARNALVVDRTIPPERIARFALLDIGPDGYLRRIVEKPTDDQVASFGADPFVSMNCWNFGPEIFRACREAPASPRGEFEIPFAVSWAMEHQGLRLRALPFQLPVLDLSQRGDVAEVKRRLAGITVRL